MKLKLFNKYFPFFTAGYNVNNYNGNTIYNFSAKKEWKIVKRYVMI